MATDTTRSSRAVAVGAFALAAAAVVAFALRGGGGYDLVARHEAAIVVWALVGLGFAFGVLPRGGWPIAGRVAVGAGLALVAWTALALTWTSSAERTGIELARVLFVVGLVVLALSLVDRRTVPAVGAGLLAGAGIVACLAFASRLYPSHFPTNYLGIYSSGKRLNYPFGYWNSVGAFLAMTVAGALAASAGAPSRVLRALSLAVVPVALGTAYMTYSRGAVGGLAVAALVVIGVSRARWIAAAHILVAGAAGSLLIVTIRHHHAIAQGEGTAGHGSVLIAALAGAVVCAAVALATGWLGLDERVRMGPKPARIALGIGVAALLVAAVVAGPRLYDRANDSFSQREAVVSSTDPAARLGNLSGQRKDLWESGLRAFKAHPLHGIGPGTFEFWWNQDPHYDGFVRDTHNLYVQTMAEDGIVGLILLAAFLLSLLVGMALRVRGPDRADRALVAGGLGLLGVYVVFAGYDWLWQSPAVTAVAIFGASAVIAGGAAPRAARAWWPLRVAVAILALVAIAAQLPALASTSQVRGSQDAARAGNFDLALSRANDAVASEPWAASAYLQRALVNELAGDLPTAAVDARRAADREREDWRPLVILARIEAEQRHVTAALRAFRRAEHLKPALKNVP